MAESLALTVRSVPQGRGLIPANGNGTAYVKAAYRRAVVEEDVQSILAGHAPVVGVNRAIRHDGIEARHRIVADLRFGAWCSRLWLAES